MVTLALSVRFVLVGITPLTTTLDEWFPLGPFEIVLVLSFLVWPAVSFFGSRKKKNVVVWVGTGGYLLVSSFYVLTPMLQYVVFGGPLMLVGAIWHSSRN